MRDKRGGGEAAAQVIINYKISTSNCSAQEIMMMKAATGLLNGREKKGPPPSKVAFRGRGFNCPEKKEKKRQWNRPLTEDKRYCRLFRNKSPFSRPLLRLDRMVISIPGKFLIFLGDPRHLSGPLNINPAI